MTEADVWTALGETRQAVQVLWAEIRDVRAYVDGAVDRVIGGIDDLTTRLEAYIEGL